MRIGIERVHRDSGGYYRSSLATGRSSNSRLKGMRKGGKTKLRLRTALGQVAMVDRVGQQLTLLSAVSLGWGEHRPANESAAWLLNLARIRDNETTLGRIGTGGFVRYNHGEGARQRKS